MVSAQTTPDGILAKTTGLILKTNGVDAKFKTNNSGYTGSGGIITSGEKFRVTLPDVEVWYNGTDLYTLNHNTQETTVVNPSSEELAEANPLSYVTGASKTYNIHYSTVKKTGKYVLELTPKKKGGEIKRITLTINRNNFYPEKIVIEPFSGSPITADITSFKPGVTSNKADFEYPKSKYLQYEVIDLR